VSIVNPRCRLCRFPGYGGQPVIRNHIHNGTETPEIVRHLVIALARHIRQLRKDGLPVPEELDELVVSLQRPQRHRPETTVRGFDFRAAPRERLSGQLLVTKAEAARRLSVSVRTVERLVTAGRLPMVHVERAARLRVSDLETFVRNLRDEQTPPDHPVANV
jgi:excisionase family DNA binding protein